MFHNIQALSRLDSAFARRLKTARDDEFSDEEMKKLLEEHYRQLEKLKHQLERKRQQMRDNLKDRNGRCGDGEDDMNRGQLDETREADADSSGSNFDTDDGSGRGRSGTFTKEKESNGDIVNVNGDDMLVNGDMHDDTNTEDMNEDEEDEGEFRNRSGTFTKPMGDIEEEDEEEEDENNSSRGSGDTFTMDGINKVGFV